jgi:hypothetical protein
MLTVRNVFAAAWKSDTIARYVFSSYAEAKKTERLRHPSSGIDLARPISVPHHEIDLETLKLLVHVAWADHRVAPEEMDHILSLARQIEAKEHEIEFLRMALEDEGRLPAPNMGLLRGQYDHVMRSIDQLIHVDKHIVDDERAVRAAVAHLLTEP